MIVSRTPFRISFFGGGTDYPDWYRANGGAVLSTSIDKYCYLTVRNLPPFFEYRHRLVYSVVENVNDPKEFDHPSARAVFQHLKISAGTSIHHDADLPARSGLGSSSAFTVGLLNSLEASRGKGLSKLELAKTAIHIEQDLIGETVGSQDQVAVAFGGLNRIDFGSDDGFQVSPLILPLERRQKFESSLMLFFTGFSRIASDVAASKTKNFDQRKSELTQMRQMVDEAQKILQQPGLNGLDQIGSLLHESWKLKKSLSDKVSTSRIDEIYEVAIRAGALGGKLLGAGGGGFILFFVPPEKQQIVREALRPLLYVKFKFETMGSHIAFYDPKIDQEWETHK